MGSLAALGWYFGTGQGRFCGLCGSFPRKVLFTLDIGIMSVNIMSVKETVTEVGFTLYGDAVEAATLGQLEILYHYNQEAN